MNITLTEHSVIIDGYEVEGFIDDERTCNSCKTNEVFYEEYDAYFCPKCNLWTEDTCSDHKCEYCFSRPAKPLPTKESK